MDGLPRIEVHWHRDDGTERYCAMKFPTRDEMLNTMRDRPEVIIPQMRDAIIVDVNGGAEGYYESVRAAVQDVADAAAALAGAQQKLKNIPR